MKVLFIGDIVGKSGRDAVSSLLYKLKSDHQIDLVIANGENAAHGKGITIRIYNELINEGIDYITMGNHTYSKSNINEHMEEMDRLIIPVNHSKRTTDNYYKIIDFKGLRFCLCNVMGQAFMNEVTDDPYVAFKKVVEETERYEPDFYFVDLHGESTAEKRLFLEYFSAYAKVVVGTHTHVQTADEAIINGSAFISDVGMVGAYDSIIGRDIEESIKANIDHEATRFTVAEYPAIFCAVIIDIDEMTKEPVSIERVQIRP